MQPPYFLRRGFRGREPAAKEIRRLHWRLYLSSLNNKLTLCDHKQEFIADGYVAIDTVGEIFDSTMKKCFGEQRMNMKILDAGAGTGMVGENLRERGYTHIDALDICQEMLDVAKEKNIYNKQICAALSEEPVSEIATGEYDGLISCGAFTEGHIGPEGFKEIVRQVKLGNQTCFFVSPAAAYTYSSKFKI